MFACSLDEKGVRGWKAGARLGSGRGWTGGVAASSTFKRVEKGAGSARTDLVLRMRLAREGFCLGFAAASQPSAAPARAIRARPLPVYELLRAATSAAHHASG